MKISFPKYGIGELLTQNRLATGIISFIAIVVFAGVFGSYFLGSKLWMLMIAALGIGGIVVYFWAAPAIFLKQNKVDEAPSTPIEENVPQIISQWDYRPRKPIRAWAVLDSPSTETSDRLSSDSFGINDNVWLNENSLEGGSSGFY